MILSVEELRGIYESVVRGSGHYDPVGYMARIILTSGGDPDYIDADGRMGLLPTSPNYAASLVGATEVQSLQGNVIATLAMDISIFQQTQDVDMALVLFHDGEDANASPSPETQEIIDNLPDARTVMYDTLFPRLAKVSDIISLLDGEGDTDVSSNELQFFEYLSNG